MESEILNIEYFSLNIGKKKKLAGVEWIGVMLSEGIGRKRMQTGN